MTHVEVVRCLEEVVQLHDVGVPLGDLLEDGDLIADLCVSSARRAKLPCARGPVVSIVSSRSIISSNLITHGKELLVQHLAGVVLARLESAKRCSHARTLMCTHSLTTALGVSDQRSAGVLESRRYTLCTTEVSSIHDNNTPSQGPASLVLILSAFRAKLEARHGHTERVSLQPTWQGTVTALADMSRISGQ